MATSDLVTRFIDGIGEEYGYSHARLTLAAELAERAHEGQTRRSGEPYVTHPMAVAGLVAEWGMDEASVVAALLHDVVEDTPMTLDEVRHAFEPAFGADVAFLVESLTKLDGLKLVADVDPDEKQAASLQKLLVAMAQDARVLIVKIADRLHNVRTLQHLNEAKARRIARETMDVYAPLAARLGMANVAGELDDRCFAVLFPMRYAELERLVAERAGERNEWIAEVVQAVESALHDAGLEAEVSGRAKRLWSVYEKMVHKGRPFDQIYDLVGVRVVVKNTTECYAALGVVHALYSPVAGRFKDWVATPRYNMYQSLHTTVVTSNGAPLEVQIRTEEMHRRAEWGVAAHWRYKSSASVEVPQWLHRLSQAEDGQEATDAVAYLDRVIQELTTREVLCFTPRGDVVTLVENSTPVDFAYAVHTDVGHACSGSRVNGALVPLSTRLRTGDRVEIITGRQGGPNRDWLHFVATPRARGRIRQWFAREIRRESSESGRSLIARELAARGVPARIVRFDALDAVAREMGYADAETLCGAVGAGRLTAAVVADRLAPAGVAERSTPERQRKGATSNNSASVLVDGIDGVPVRLSRCCSPVPGDEITGHVSKHGNERVVSVHRTGCEAVTRAEPRTPVEVSWQSSSGTSDGVLLVQALDRAGLLSDVARAIADGGGVILASSTAVGADMVSRQRFDVAVADVEMLEDIIRRAKAVSGVFTAGRG
jgi:guanosine-3',5'-bis(diphosphate) 3'-pyrophosphohydrolase